ncbi:MAG: hypothetical protein U1F35_10010 [Steroidobacteraceae bacterium]
MVNIITRKPQKDEHRPTWSTATTTPSIPACAEHLISDRFQLRAASSQA